MFTLTRLYRNQQLPVSVLYVDALYQPYQFAGITIQATEPEDILTIQGGHTTATFNGHPFPLKGLDFLTVVTGTMQVTVTQALSTGIHTFSLVNQLALFSLLGGTVSGVGALGTQAIITTPVGVQLQIQSFEIPGVVLPSQATTSTVPTAWV